MAFFKSFGVHVGQRMHAATAGLFRSTDQAETGDLYNRVAHLFASAGIDDEGGYHSRLITGLAADACLANEVPLEAPIRPAMEQLIASLVESEALFMLPAIDWSERRTTSEWWVLRDELLRQKALVEDGETHLKLLLGLSIQWVQRMVEHAPALAQPTESEADLRPDDLTMEVPLLESVGDAKALVAGLLELGLASDVQEVELLPRFQAALTANLIAASGGNPEDPAGFNKTPVWPEKASAKNPTELADQYLAGTPLRSLLDLSTTLRIPLETRFEHTHIVAGTGHGKTQTLQHLIHADLEAVARGERSLVVIDSQGDLINNLARLKVFAPGAPLHDRLVLIDPTDVEWPVSLNMFDVGLGRLETYGPLERERLLNSIIELYDFVLGSLLDAGMTQKQSVIFRYVTRLMLHIPGATIHTLRELMEPDSHIAFAEHIAKLDGTPRRFFETEFADKEFSQTKKQVLRRLWGILENQTFERMFSHPQSKLDLFTELNAGKVILINTAKDLLKEQGTQILGRFFIALIAQAAQERAVLPASQRKPTMVYVDEAADYFDRNIGIILAQARKYRVGMILAHQYLGQLDPKLQEAFASNTSIKLVGGVSSKDAKAFAPSLRCEPVFIEAQKKGSFAASVRGVTGHAVPLRFPFGTVEQAPQMGPEEQEQLREVTRGKYAVHHSELGSAETAPEQDKPPEPQGSGGGSSEAAPAEPDTAQPSKPKAAANKKPPKPQPPPAGSDDDIKPSSDW